MVKFVFLESNEPYRCLLQKNENPLPNYMRFWTLECSCTFMNANFRAHVLQSSMLNIQLDPLFLTAHTKYILINQRFYPHRQNHIL